MCSIRWAFDFGSWSPTESEWLLAARCIQQAEKDKIGRKGFTVDCKASMAGRLMIRKVISDELKIPWDQVRLARGELGKPYVSDLEPDTSFDFNISHHGKFVVLAADGNGNQCGIDILDSDRPVSKPIPDYFRMMEKSGTAYEWSVVKGAGTERQQLHMFYRFWCLKESYIKALGQSSIYVIGPQKVEFRPKTLALQTDSVAMDTELYFEGEQQKSWIIQETMLDESHYVAVALKGENSVETQDTNPMPFQTMTFSDLISSAVPILPDDPDYWTLFLSKKEKRGTYRFVEDRDRSEDEEETEDEHEDIVPNPAENEDHDSLCVLL